VGDHLITHDDRVYAGQKLLLDVGVNERSLEKSPPPRERWLAQLAKAEVTLAGKPDDPAARFQAGEARFFLGRDAEARKDLDTALASKPLPLALRHRAILHLRNGRPFEAGKDFQAFARGNRDADAVTRLRANLAAYYPDGTTAWATVEEGMTGPKGPALFAEVAKARVLAARIAATRYAAWAAGVVARCGFPGPPAVAVGDAGKHLAAAEELLRRAVDTGATDAPGWADDEEFAPLRGRPAFTRLTAAQPAGAELRYASTWAWRPDREAAGLHGLTREAHLERCRELAAKGWRPAGISIAGGLAASVWHRPAPTAERSVAAGRREAAAAATLLNLKEPRPTWPVWKHRPDPTAQSYLTALAGPLGVDADALVKRLDEEKDASARRALILALGEYADRGLPAAVRGPLVTKLLTWYRDDPDPGVHGAIDWLLRHGHEGPVPRPLDWGQAEKLERIDADLASRRREPPEGARHGWTVNGEGQTYVVVRGPVEYRMGSPPWDAERQDPKDERPHRRIIRHGFAIAASPVTVREWQRFLKERPEVLHSYLEGYAPQPDCPIVGVTMYEAMAYCNWLSKKEGIPESEWCYPGKIEAGMKVPADLLRRKGYRLPMEAEWEYAARAGAGSSRSFGEGEELRRRHAWYLDNARQRTWPIKMKRPNGLGLSDVHGNASCWCHDPGAYYLDYARMGVYQHMLIIEEQRSRVLRGGAFDVAAPFVRSADRNFVRPWSRVSTYGVRPSRTYH
jgi:formylglycine-generating enzyme required for sulfatase activity